MARFRALAAELTRDGAEVAALWHVGHTLGGAQARVLAEARVGLSTTARRRW